MEVDKLPHCARCDNKTVCWDTIRSPRSIVSMSVDNSAYRCAKAGQ